MILPDIFILIGIVVTVLIALASILYVYKDSQKRNLNTFFWCALQVILPYFIGFLLYFILRDFFVTIKCGNCNRSIKPYFYSCPYCNTELKTTAMSYNEKKKTKKNKVLRAFIIFTTVIILLFPTTLLILNLAVGSKASSMKIEENWDNKSNSFLTMLSFNNNSTNHFDHKYEFLDGHKSRTIEIEEDGILNIVYEIENSAGEVDFTLYQENKLIYSKHILTDSNGIYEVEVKAGETIILSLLFNKSKGYHSFSWNLKGVN